MSTSENSTSLSITKSLTLVKDLEMKLRGIIETGMKTFSETGIDLENISKADFISYFKHSESKWNEGKSAEQIVGVNATNYNNQLLGFFDDGVRDDGKINNTECNLDNYKYMFKHSERNGGQYLDITLGVGDGNEVTIFWDKKNKKISSLGLNLQFGDVPSP